MIVYRAPTGTYYEKQADMPKGTKFEAVDYPFAASPKGDFVRWLNEQGLGDAVHEIKAQPAPIQPTPAHSQQLLAFEDQFEAMPLATQLHYAALAVENARKADLLGTAPAKAPQRYGDR